VDYFVTFLNRYAGELAFEYSRDQLLSLRLAAGLLPDIAIRRRIDNLLRPASRRSYRGCRAGRRKDQVGVQPGFRRRIYQASQQRQLSIQPGSQTAAT
jgi:hypothetical protein